MDCGSLVGVGHHDRVMLRVAHGEEWDSAYFDRTVGISDQPTAFDYTNPLTWQGVTRRRTTKFSQASW